MQRVSLDIKRWIKEEEVSCRSISDSRPSKFLINFLIILTIVEPIQWKVTYVMHLVIMYSY